MALFPGKIHFYHGKGAVPSNIHVLCDEWTKIMCLIVGFKEIAGFGRQF